MEEDHRIVQLREDIHRDYDDVFLGTEPLKDPPVRGPYGYAYIPLKENAVPTRAKPFRLHGERFEAHRKVTEEWQDRGYIERIPEGFVSEWMYNTFVVPKKGGEWRGVVDI